MLFSAAGNALGPRAAPFATAMTVMLLTSGIAYLLALGTVFREPLKRS